MEQTVSAQSPSPAEVDKLVACYLNGDRHAAKALAMSITQRFPNHQFSWKVLGAVLQQSGEISESVIANQKAAWLDPEDAEAHSNLGVTLTEIGRFEDAEASHNRALVLAPNLPVAHYNLGITLKQLGRLEESEASYRKALELAPDYAAAHGNLGGTLKELGRLEESEACYRKAIALEQGNAIAHSNLGSTLQELGRLDEAVASHRQAIALKADYAQAHNNLGVALQELGRLSEAQASYRSAIALNPNFVQAHLNLGRNLLESNHLPAALDAAVRLARTAPTVEARGLFVDVAKRASPQTWDDTLSETVCEALLEPWGRPSDLAKFACQLLKTDPTFMRALELSRDGHSQDRYVDMLFSSDSERSLAPSRLLFALLSSSPIADAEIEALCTGLRQHVLEANSADMLNSNAVEVTPALCCALAQQCFINEYVYFQTPKEIEDSESLKARLVQALESAQAIPAAWVIAVACYFPLYSVRGAEKLLQLEWSSEVRAVLIQQLQEPLDELQLRTSIPCLSGIENQISLAVQSQYEENPYPRWVRLPQASSRKFLNSYVQSKFPLASFHRFADDKPPEILVAGCGTGQHPIGTVQAIKDATLLAIDLSQASLAYAKRKTIELNIESIEYAQADLLKLGSLGRTFDVIESSGVLHHLENPFEGLQVLLGLLRPHGLMRLGFYSELARRDIVRVRNLIRQDGVGSSAQDIRNYRKHLFGVKNSREYGFATSSSDFFSTSACRDLLFHVQEHRMNLGTLAIFFEDHDLNFLGFECDRSVIQAYKRRFPSDSSATNLENWRMYEEENPNTFVGMYQFWLQKK